MNRRRLQTLTRGRFITWTGAVGGAVLAWSAVGKSPLYARSLRVPAVDNLSIRVAIDNSHEFLDNQNIGNVLVERSNPDLSLSAPKKLEGQFGLSLFLESKIGDESRRYLLDFGLTGDVLLNNLDVLKIDPATIDALILSHGHIDHFGGLVPFLAADRQTMRRDLTLYAGGEENFCYQHLRRPDGQFVDAGVLDRRNLAAANVRTVLAEQPTVIEGHAFTTGVIPRTDFEKVFPNTWLEVGVRDGAGCSPDHFTEAERQGKIVANLHRNEHATCFYVRDRGLVIITSCGHVGLLNTIKRAQQVSGISKVHAVVGGFHLFPAPVPYVADVVAALKTVYPDVVIPMHCSGQNFSHAMREQMPDKLVISSIGSRYTFGA